MVGSETHGCIYVLLGRHPGFVHPDRSQHERDQEHVDHEAGPVLGADHSFSDALGVCLSPVLHARI